MREVLCRGILARDGKEWRKGRRPIDIIFWLEVIVSLSLPGRGSERLALRQSQGNLGFRREESPCRWGLEEAWESVCCQLRE